jgi:hypothetical protein
MFTILVTIVPQRRTYGLRLQLAGNSSTCHIPSLRETDTRGPAHMRSTCIAVGDSFEALGAINYKPLTT